MTRPRIGIILSTTRQGRFADRPAEWILNLAAARGDAAYEIVDLRDYPLPMFGEPMSPRFTPPQDAVAQRWAARIADLDGFIFVTAEYNHAVTGVLKNAMDYLYGETQRKPAAFVGYGGVGGARAVEQMRLIVAEQGMVSVRSAVHIGMEPFLGLLQQGKQFEDYAYLGDAAKAMLEELGWWTALLKAGRQQAETAAAA